MQKVLDFYFCKPAFFPTWPEVYHMWNNSSWALWWTFTHLYSKWALPEQCLELSLWQDLRLEYLRPKRTLSLLSSAPVVQLFSHRECHCHGLVWVRRLWYLISHTSLRVQRWSLVSEEKCHDLCSAMFPFGGFIHPQCEVPPRGNPLESPPPPQLVLESSRAVFATPDCRCLLLWCAKQECGSDKALSTYVSLVNYWRPVCFLKQIN